jgi:outer membrane protein assembly factor BamB
MKAAAAAVCLALVTVLGIAEPAAATARSGSRPAAVQEARTRSAPLRITTRWLAAGTRGLSYLQVLTASGGKAPYRWSATGMPSGLSMSTAGLISGFPRRIGSREVTLRVRDAPGRSRTVRLRLRVPESLPTRCLARSCALLSPDGHTVHIPASHIVSVATYGSSGTASSVVLTGLRPAKGDILVLAPITSIPSGLIALATSVAPGPGAHESTIAVRRATPAEAYYQGIVQTSPPAGKAAAADQSPAAPGTRSASIRSSRSAPTPDAGLSCTGGVNSSLHGLTVQPNLKPSLTLDWKHNRYGGNGIYLGTGGLKLFQFGLTGAITVNLGVSLSGRATCKLDLPSAHAEVPAGDLGAVVLTLDPVLDLTSTGKVGVQTSVTLTCHAQYEWNQGSIGRADYCTATHQPLGVESATGADLTVTGTLDASVSLDDLAGITGSLIAAVHTGYHPEQDPVWELDADANYDMKATLAAFWSGAPTLRIASGEIFNQVLFSTGKPDVTTSWSQLGGDSGHDSDNPAESLLGSLNAHQVATAWEATASGFSEAGPTVSGGTVFLAGGSELEAVSTAHGTTEWTQPGSFRLAAPVVADARVIVGDLSGVVRAYNANTGTASWSKTVGTTLPVVTSWPGNLAASTSAGNTVTVLNPTSGAVRWTKTVSGDVSGTAEADGIVVVTTSTGHVYGLNAGNGVRKWQATVSAGGTLQPPVVSGTAVYVGGPSAVASLTLTGGRTRWRYADFGSANGDNVESRPATNGTTLIVGLGSGNLVALSASAGRRLWTAAVGGYVQAGTPAIANGLVWACNSSLLAFNLSTGTQIVSIPIPTLACNSSDVAVVEGSVYATVLNLDDDLMHVIAVRLP